MLASIVTSMPIESVRIVQSLDNLVAELEDRRPFSHSDSLSGNRFESVRYRGEQMILKYVCVDDDWIMRASGDIDSRVLRLFRSDVIERLPQSIEHMAQLHAAFWGWEDRIELMPLAHHYAILTPTMAALEAERGGADPVPPAVAAGWAELQGAWPALATTLSAIAHDPGPLAVVLRRTPQTFVHGDWKLGNLGEHADGRTVLLDWDRSGAAPATFDFAWCLAVNCDRMPQGKEEAIAAYRRFLEAGGIETAGWWDEQVSLTLLGAGVMLAWAKVGDVAELGWWADRIDEGARRLP
jgi:hypothetical protein